MSKTSTAGRDEAIETLREIITPGAVIYTAWTGNYRGSDGMDVDRYTLLVPLINRDGTPWIRDVTRTAAVAMGDRLNKFGSINMGGCGYNKGFQLVYNLGRTLFADDFTCIGASCPSNDHANGDRDHTPHKHSDPGYALTQRQL